MTTQQLIRPRQASEKLGCSLATIYRMFERGELTRIQITKGSVGIPSHEIEKILNPDLKEQEAANHVVNGGKQ